MSARGLKLQADYARELYRDYGIDGDEDRISVAESETSLPELIGRLKEAEFEDEATIHACKVRIEELKIKVSILEDRISARNHEIGQVLADLGLKGSINCGTVKVWKTPTKPKVLITDEEKLPADLWRETVTREPNKTAIMERLERGEPVEGAAKSNGGYTIVTKRT